MTALSGGSLLLCGLASLLLSTALWSPSGLLIGAALSLHGAFELTQRKRVLRDGDSAAIRRLAWNQLALAASVSLYLAWQISIIDRAAIHAMLQSGPVSSVLELYPQETAQVLERNLPAAIGLFYSIAMLATVVGCIGMALYYRRSGRRFCAAPVSLSGRL